MHTKLINRNRRTIQAMFRLSNSNYNENKNNSRDGLYEGRPHALGCMKGGLVTRRHNEVRDEIADLVQMAYGPSAIRIEPTVRESTTSLELRRASRRYFGEEGL